MLSLLHWDFEISWHSLPAWPRSFRRLRHTTTTPTSNYSGWRSSFSSRSSCQKLHAFFWGVFNLISDCLHGFLVSDTEPDCANLETGVTRVELVANTSMTLKFARTDDRYSENTGTTCVSGPLSYMDIQRDNVWSRPTVSSWSQGLARALSDRRDTCISVVSTTRNKPRKSRRDCPRKGWLNQLRTKGTREGNSSGSRAALKSSTKSVWYEHVITALKSKSTIWRNCTHCSQLRWGIHNAIISSTIGNSSVANAHRLLKNYVTSMYCCCTAPPSTNSTSPWAVSTHSTSFH